MNTARTEAIEHLRFHHSGADGWITMAQKEAQGFRQRHYRPDELAQHLAEWTGENVYFSQNTFFKPQRRIDNIRQLRALYVDLDVYRKGMTPEYALGKLDFEFFGQTIPEPNMIIYSGRGLVLVWNIEPLPYMAMPLWKAIEGHFVKTLESLGADPKASDPTRIFRIAGSINSKSGTAVKAEYRHQYRYDLRDLEYEYLPELSTKPPKRKPGRKPGIIHLFNIYTLHLARAKDIAKLVELRRGKMDSYREFICFLYRYYTCCYTSDPEQALAQTMDLNQEFTRPLPEREVIRATKSAQKAWEAKSNKAANEAAQAAGFPGAGYNLKNSKLIEWLDITPDEERAMSTIIGPKEKRRRNLKQKEEKRRSEGIRAAEEYHQERKEKKLQEAAELQEIIRQNNKLSVRQLAELTGISKSKVARLMKI